MQTKQAGTVGGEIVQKVLKDICTCEFCGVKIDWEGRDDQCDTIFYCEKCGKMFCEKCFIDKHGYDKWLDNFEADKLVCPECYGEK